MEDNSLFLMKDCCLQTTLTPCIDSWINCYNFKDNIKTLKLVTMRFMSF